MSDQPERESRQMSVIPAEAAEWRTVLQPEGFGERGERRRSVPGTGRPRLRAELVCR